MYSSQTRLSYEGNVHTVHTKLTEFVLPETSLWPVCHAGINLPPRCLIRIIGTKSRRAISQQCGSEATRERAMAAFKSNARCATQSGSSILPMHTSAGSNGVA